MTLMPWLETALARVLSSWIRPDVLPRQPAERVDPSRPVLYLLEVGGLADRTALSLTTRSAGLPSPREPLRYAGSSERSGIDVITRRPGLGLGFGKRQVMISRRLTRLVAARIASKEALPDLQIVPVAVYWGRAPAKDASLFRLLFAENWALGGRVAKLVTTLIHGRNTLVQFSEPLSLETLVRTENLKGVDAERLTRKLSRVLRVHFRQRRIATLGPDRSHRRTLLSQVLADPSVRRSVNAEVDKGRNRERVERSAHGYAREIAADVSYATIRILDRLLTRLWTELYDGVKLSGIERLRAVADGRELVYVPCHRSHIDYLLLSYILVKEGFSLPHVAAGVNLNLPVVGGILRRGGAFFLRRSFSGNALYASVFSAYLEQLIRRGHAIEYFIEGGRSRTGRLLPAKGGMLAMTAQAYLRQPDTPVVFVPIYFGYERLLEGGAFTSELAGGKKRKESLLGLLGSLKRLRERYGRVHVNIGEPVALDALLERHRPGWREEPPPSERPPWLKPVIDELGTTVLRRINEAASVTPVSLLASAILATTHGRLGRAELARQIELYGALLRITHAGTHVEVPDLQSGNGEAVIEHGVALGYLEVSVDAIGELVSLRDNQAAALTYFRNNILHLLTLPALLASAFGSRRRCTDVEVRELAQVALPFLHGELFMRERGDDAPIVRALDALESEGLIERHGELWRRAPGGTPEAVSLLRLAQTVLPALERFYLCSALLVRAGNPLPRDELARRCAAGAERLESTEGRNRLDLHDKHLFEALIERLIALDYVRDTEAGLAPTDRLQRLEDEARRVLDDHIRHAILRATHAATASGKAASAAAQTSARSLS